MENTELGEEYSEYEHIRSKTTILKQFAAQERGQKENNLIFMPNYGSFLGLNFFFVHIQHI